MEGALGASRNAGTSNYNYEPSLILGYAVSGRGYEVIKVSSGGASHVVALTTLNGETARDVPRRTLVWGSNLKGQIGAPETVEPAIVPPRRLLRSLFPLLLQGNLIDSTNRRVCFYKWNTSVVPGWNTPLQEVLIATGVRGIKEIESDINTQMGGNYISITTDEESERVSVSLLESGVQFDFASRTCSGLAKRLAFSQPWFKLPANGFLNEISARLNNNVLVLRQWHPIYFTEESYVLFRSWSSTHSASRVYNISIDLYGSTGMKRFPRGPVELASELNRAVQALGQGLPSDLFDFGQDVNFPRPVVLTMKYSGYQFLFEESFASWQLPPIDMLGLKNTPSVGFFKGKFGKSVPNEVSDNAGTRHFNYRYMSAQHSSCMLHTIDLDEGVRTLNQVLRDIQGGLRSNGHPEDAFDLAVDTDGFVSLQIRRPGFQVVFSNTSIGNYLGFDDMRDFPCNPIKSKCSASEVVDAGCENATRDGDATTLGPDREWWCGVSNGTDLFQKRGSSPRTFASLFTAAGDCLRQDSRVGKCACNMSQYLCIISEDTQISRTQRNTTDTPASGNCSCSSRSFFYREEGYQPWGVTKDHSVTFNDGIYDVASLNQVLDVSLLAKGFGPPTLRFVEEGSKLRMSLFVNNVPVPSSRIQVDFNISSIAEFLGFTGVAQPPGFAESGFQIEAHSESTLVSGYRETASANTTGEWIVDVASGHEHTLVQTCRGGDFVAGTVCLHTRLWALGSNQHGQLGTSHHFSTNITNAIPLLVDATSDFDPINAKSIYAGGRHSAVVDVNGKIWTFGDNTYGQCGDSSIYQISNNFDWQPRQLRENAFGAGRLRNISLALGQYHTLVRAVDTNTTGILWAFGRNQFGQLGLGQTGQNDTQSLGTLQRLELPVGAGGVSTHLCAGGYHSVFQTADGQLWAVGRNTHGQLGVSDSAGADMYASPLRVGSDRPTSGGWIWQNPFPGPITSIGCGHEHTGVVSGNRMYTFGSNVLGQLLQESNVGLNNPSDTPVIVKADFFLGDSRAVSPQLPIQIWLSGDATFVQTLRQACIPGTSSPDGHQPCFRCAGGKYQPQSQSRSCIPCQLGHYSFEGQVACALCSAGKYTNTTGMGQCHTCPQPRPGTFGEGAITQDNCTKFCESGSFGTFGTPPCSICGPGTYSITTLGAGPVTCMLCARGTYQPLNETSSCIDCAVGNSTPSQGTHTEKECRLVCSSGTFGAYGLAPCTPCLPGTVAPLADSTECDVCGNGTYMKGSGETACLACPAGKGTNGEGKMADSDCIPLCPPGNFSDVGVEPCQQCRAGFYSSQQGQKYCDPCGPGNFSTAGQSVCERCRPGSVVAGTGNSECDLCRSGQFQAVAGETVCEACATGKYQNSTGMSACYPCAGELSTRPPNGNIGANSSTECQRFCPPGSTSPNGLVPFDSDTCTACPDGFSTTQEVNGTYMLGATRCFQCLAGTFAPVGAPICLRCPAGTFSNTSFSNTSDAPCRDCQPGYTSNPGATVCLACTPGSFTSDFGQPNCTQCSPGTYQNSTASTLCIDCPQGYHAPSSSWKEKCAPCLAGKYSSASKASVCLSCSAGYFSNQADHKCTACQNGTFSATISSGSCQACQIGKYADGSNFTGCLDCSPGHAANSSSAVCSACLQGTYSSGSLATCAACPNGFNTRSNQAVTIDECVRICLPGQFGSQGLSRLRNESCSPCAKAYFSAKEYATTCTACPAGTFAAVTGSSQCESCAAGSFAANTSFICTLCSPGKFQNNTSAPACPVCGLGTFSTGQGSTICNLCDLGTYQDQPGTSSCVNCVIGKSTPFAGGSNASDCQSFCLQGYFGLSNGVERPDSLCRRCMPGSYNPYMKMTSCFSCRAGTFTDSSQATVCQNCGVNQFTAKANSSSCEYCGPNVLNASTYTLSTTALPYWIARGANKQLECREIEDPCSQNPRNLSVYPTYQGGQADYGQMTGANKHELTRVETGPVNLELRQTILPCKVVGGEDVSRFQTGGFHSVVETARVLGVLGYGQSSELKIDRALWTLGSNSHGQLGTATNAGTLRKSSAPSFVPRYLFPAMASANEISEQRGNNIFVYWMFDTSLEMRVRFNITIQTGHYSPVDVARYVSSEASRSFGHPADMFSVETDTTGQLAIFMVARPAFQADFTQDGTPRQNFGISPSKIPPNGTLNEISAATGNNVFAYRVWCGTVLTGTCTQSRTVHVTLPDGVYTLESLQAEIASATLHNGDDESRFIFYLVDNRVNVEVDVLFQIIFDQNTVADFLGFDAVDIPANPVNESRVFIAQNTRPWLAADGTQQTSFPSSDSATGQMISQFRLGYNHTFVQTWEVTDVNISRSRLWAFGSNLMGQLGVQANAGTNIANYVPIPIPEFDEMNGGRRAIKFKAGAAHTMVLDETNGLWLFGSNEFGQLGNASHSGLVIPNWQPTRFNIESLHPYSWVSEFEPGSVHSVVMSIDVLGEQKVWLFGSNQYGQLGNSTMAGICKDPLDSAKTKLCDGIVEEFNRYAVANWQPRQLNPLLVANQKVASFYAGGFHNLILTVDGRMWCFGSNEFGQCGFEYNTFGNVQDSSVTWKPILLGSKNAVNDNSRVIQPPAECCTPGVQWLAANSAQCPNATFWRSDDVDNGVPVACPFGSDPIQVVQVGEYHTLVLTGDPPGDTRYWSFGLNDHGQLFRETNNLGNRGPNEMIEVIPGSNFGYGKQVRIAQATGKRQGFIQTVRLHCEPGNHSIDRREPCERCEPGSYSETHGTLTDSIFSFDQSVEHPYTSLMELRYKDELRISCNECSAGNFSSIAGQSACGICQVGTYSFGGASACHNCYPGTYTNITQSSNCTLCEAGLSSNESAEECFPCDPGTYTFKRGTPACLKCALGKFNPSSGVSFCLQCDVDWYQDKAGQTACTNCPDRMATAFPGSTSVNDCLSLCSPGEYGETLPGGTLSIQPCDRCIPGYFASERGMTSCVACAGGYFTYFNASMNCSACPGGSFSTSASTVCTICARGTFSLVNSSTCTECASGKFSVGGGNVTACTSCEAGFQQNSTGKSVCTVCPSGTASASGSAFCLDCGPGTYSQAQSPQCFNCSGGYFSGVNGLSMCDACSPGTYSEIGASTCIDCRPGLFAFGPFLGYAATACQDCLSGQFSAHNATANCTLCPAGSFGDSDSMSVCDLCVPGYHTPACGYTECTRCVPGTFSLQNFTACTNCSTGEFNNVFGQQNCSECSPGYYGPRTGLTVCAACAGGTHGNVSGLSRCYDCNPGVVSTSNATVCSSCVPGTIAPTTRMTSCILCSVGQFNTVFEAIHCEQCPDSLSTQGTGAGLLGRPSAVPEWYNSEERCMPECKSGEFSIWGVRPIYDNCTKCPEGYFSPNNGSTSCAVCAGGSFSSQGLSACILCAPGTFSKIASPQCTRCSSGSFGFLGGQSSCTLCPQKMFSTSPGQTSCEHCPMRVDPTVNTLYYTDCRAVCSSRDLLIANVTPPLCCHDVDYNVIQLTSETYYLKELEAEINRQVLNASGINELVRLEMDYLAVSRSGSLNETTIQFNIQYGGFLFHMYDPENPSGFCLTESRRDQSQSQQNSQAIQLPSYCTDPRNLGALFGFKGVVPALGATPCHFVGENPRIDGGCYSQFMVRSPALPYTLFTKSQGANSSTACEAFCPKGTFSADGLEKLGLPCSFCNTGNFSDDLGSTSCKECSPGGYSGPAGGYSVCEDCEKGKSQHVYASTNCIFCAVGTFSPFEGGVACLNCLPGTYSLTTGAAASLDGSFYELTSANNASYTVNALPDTCLECPPGQVSALEQSTNCTYCPRGAVSVGAGYTSCSLCHPGHFADAKGSSLCTQCVPGSRSEFPSSSTGCVWCVAGSASPGPASICKDCVPGKFSKDRAAFCPECLPGFHSVSFASTQCEPCVPGTMSIGNQQYCDACAPGKYANLTNSSACIDCVAGSFSARQNSSTCLLCPHGKFSLDDSSMCTLCPPGHNTTGRAKTLPVDCIRKCNEGFSGFNGVLPCFLCQPGGVGSMVGTQCRIESKAFAIWEDTGLVEEYIVDGKCLNNTCPLCEAGKYSPQSGLSTCFNCAQHSYSHAGQANCTKCPGVTVTAQTASTSLQECQRKCTPGAYSLDGLSPCKRCNPGNYGKVFGMSVCDVCVPGKFQSLVAATSCFFCPPGKSTFLPGKDLARSCQGIAPKYLYDDEALHLTCASDFAFNRDEGSVNNVLVHNPGEGYIAGLLAMVGGQGQGFSGSFDVNLNGSITLAVVESSGVSYTSSGHLDVFYVQIQDPTFETSLEIQAPGQRSRSQIMQPDQISNKSMTGTISQVFSYPYFDLVKTPANVLVGCKAGHVEVDRVSGGHGFKADYSVPGFANAFKNLCIGLMNHSSGTCHQILDNHGINYSSRPQVRLVETIIQSINMKTGPDSTIRGCNFTNSKLRAYGGGPQSNGFQGSYTIVPGTGGSITTVKIDKAGEGYETIPSLYPEDPMCICGSSIGHIRVVNGGKGYTGTYSNTTAGFIVKSPNSRFDFGMGLKATFGTDGQGHLTNVDLVDGGSGYTGERVDMVACPISCCPLFDTTCCFNTPVGASCRHGILQEAVIEAEVGLRGGVPGKNFDRCLEAVIDRSACRCGSAIEKLEIVDAGSGFVNGSLSAFETLPSECYDPCLVTAVVTTDILNSTKATNTTICNTTCTAACSQQCIAITSNDAGAYSMCMFNCTKDIFWKSQVHVCKPWRQPHYCNVSGKDFIASFFVDPARTCPDDPRKDTNISRCANNSVVRGLSGAISGVSTANMGRGYNKSQLGVRVLYAGAVRCDNGTGDFSTTCEQATTVTEIVVQGNSSFVMPPYYSLLANETSCTTTCDGIANCSGFGFAAHLVLHSITRISSMYEPLMEMTSISSAEITNHGTGYSVLFPPRIRCTLHGVFRVPLATPLEPCFRNGTSASNLSNCTYSPTNPASVQNSTNYSNNTVLGPWDLYIKKILVYLDDVNWLSGSGMNEPQKLLPVIPNRGLVDMKVGRQSDEFGSSDACLGVSWANSVLLGAGPLMAMEVRLFGSFLTHRHTHLDRIVLDDRGLSNDRLFFFLKATFGSESVELNNCMCHLQPEIKRNSFAEVDIHRSIECVCMSDFWGLEAKTSLFFIETSNRTSTGSTDYFARTQVDLAILKVATSFSGVWTPFMAQGLPLFGETPASSWVHSLAFGKPIPFSSIDLHIKASTVAFNYSMCAICDSLPPHEQVVTDGLLHGIFNPGLQFKGAKANLVAGPDGKFHILGLERMFSEIHAGTQLFTIEGQQHTLDCLFHETQKMEWKLIFDATIPFHPAGSLVVAKQVTMTLAGIREHEDLNLDIPLTAYLEENHAFNLSSKFTWRREDAVKNEAPFNAVANTSEWDVAFNLKWLIFDEVDAIIEGVQIKNILGINITHFTFNGNGSATFINDPWTSGGERAQVAIDFRGTSGRVFPHVSSEISAHLTTPDPAAVVRTLMQQALHLNYSNPTCGTTACQDLLFVQKDIRIVMSTWDSDAIGFAVPSRDARSYSCVTTNGNVASGSPCFFPFEYNGQIFTECTSQNWQTPWCSTTPVYAGTWGECVCNKLRRGVQLTGQVDFYEGGPLRTLNEAAVLSLLEPIAAGNGFAGVNGTLKMYFPIFDSDASNDLEMLVMLVPHVASQCVGGNNSKAVPTVGTAPSGDCERLGYITEWFGEPGDESMVVCKHPDEVFPSGISAQFVAAATYAMQDLGTSDSDAYVSTTSPVDEAQACADMGLAREIALCTAEKFRNILVAAPELFGRQFCFWTDTSKTPGLEENKFAQCAVCHGPSCTANHEPLRAWQLKDRVCYSFPCV